MGGSDQPFLYPPCTPLSQRKVAYPYSNFNPKAVTQASYQALHDQNRPRPKQEGPLLRFDQPANSYTPVPSDNSAHYNIKTFDGPETRRRVRGEVINYNQHPDSWTIVAGHNVKYKPMPDNTKTMVQSLRWLQFTLRVVEGVTAAGLVVCMSCMRDMPNTFSWIMRIAPAWDVIVSMYAIYHLVRPATARTPASSASYHLFAVCMDVALLPFYVYLSLYAHVEYGKSPAASERWTSVFTSIDGTTQLLLATFVAAAAISGLHLLSAALDVWLVLIFRQIARLPPDVNPLEDNLTSRAPRTSKHKYKNSEATLTGGDWSEKKPGYLSGSTLGVDRDSRFSNATRDMDDADSRQVPFGHSRVKSNTAFSPHNPETARLSHQHFEDVDLYESARSSPRPNRDSPSRQLDRDLARNTLSRDGDEAIPWPPQVRDRSSRPGSSAAMMNEADITDFAHVRSRNIPNAASPQSKDQSQQKETLLKDDNWYVIDDDSSTLASARPYSSHDEPIDRHDSFQPQPLKMHPPTPPPMHDEEQYPDPEDEDEMPTYQPIITRRPLTTRSDVGNGSAYPNLTVPFQSAGTAASSTYSSDDESEWKENVRGGTPKRKYYGDLAAATRGVLGTVKYKSMPTAGNGGKRVLSTETDKSNGTVDAAAMDSTGMSALGGYGYGRVTPGTYGKSHRKGQEGKARVVSRSGVDVVDIAEEEGRGSLSAHGGGAGSGGMGGFGMRGRRDVSGKVAEEGRAGNAAWWSRKIY